MSEKEQQASCPTACPTAGKKTSIGGQALMEGIMMRGPEKTAMAIRNAKGEILLESFDTPVTTSKFKKLPFIRGIFGMISSMTLGYKCLMRSADVALADAEEADRAAKAAKEEADTNALSSEALPEDAAKTEPTKKKPTEAPADAENPAGIAGSAAVSEGEAETAPLSEDTSAEPALNEEAAAEKNAGETKDETKKEGKKASKKSGGAATTLVMVLGVVLGVLLAIGLFIAAPSYLFKLIAGLANINLETNSYGVSLLRSVFEGVLKILILVLYMFLVSRMKDIRRVFMYHGAEHKTIFCYEQGLPLTVENVRIQRRFHPRCGTSFLILVLLVSMVLGFFIPAFLDTWLRVLIKLALLPLTVGIGYELIKLAGRKDNLFTRITSAPGVWLQHITTVEPDDGMIECAIAAMTEVIPEDKSKDNW